MTYIGHDVGRRLFGLASGHARGPTPSDASTSSSCSQKSVITRGMHGEAVRAALTLSLYKQLIQISPLFVRLIGKSEPALKPSNGCSGGNSGGAVASGKSSSVPQPPTKLCKTTKKSASAVSAQRGVSMAASCSPQAVQSESPPMSSAVSSATGSVKRASKPPVGPQMPVSVVGRSLRKLVALLEQVPPSIGTEEPLEAGL